MNFAFFGTDEFAVTILEELKSSDLIPSLIVTTPDTPRGRNLVLTPPPVKVWAEQNGIKFLQPENLKDPAFISQLQASNSRLFIVASYGKIIPKAILDLPQHGTLNIHPSLLPKYRGSSPLQSAILNGDTETGVTIMLLDEEMDHGPILIARREKLGERSFVELRDDLAKIGAQLLAKILPDYLSGKLKPVEQDHSQATYTKKITKEMGQLDLSADPVINDRKIRALNPNPGTYFIDSNNKRIKVLSAHLENGQLIFDRVIPEGKKEMDWESYRRGLTK